MATIKISDLHPAGYDLFSDEESYLMSLTEDELNVQGGATAGLTILTPSTWACVGIGTAVATVSFAASYIKGRWF